MTYIQLTKNSIGDISKVMCILSSKDKSQIESLDILTFLESCPFLIAECDLENVLKKMLLHKYPAFRWQAALLLHLSGDSIGLKHLVYNAVRIHPILGQKQLSGFHDLPALVNELLLPYTSKLSLESLDLLMEDFVDEKGNRQFEILSMVHVPSILDKLASFLDRGGGLTLMVSYILALNGRTEGREILEKIVLLEDVKKILGCEKDELVEKFPQWIILALKGLSKFDDDDALSIFQKYRDEKKRKFGLDHELDQMLSKTIYFLQDRSLQRVINYVMHFNNKELNNKGKKGIVIKGLMPEPFFANQSIWGIFNFLDLFASENEKKVLYDYQMSKITNVMNLSCIDDDYFIGLPNPNILKGLNLSFNYQREDYINACTDWVLNPEKYKRGIYHSSYLTEPGNKPNFFQRLMKLC